MVPVTTQARRAATALAAVALIAVLLTVAPVPVPAGAATSSVDWGDLDTSSMVDVGDADPTTEVTFLLGLHRDRAGLTAFARSVSDPSSSSYGRYLRVPELAARFGASAATKATVVDYFAGLGITATVDVTGTYANVQLPVSTIETVFSADWRLFSYPPGNFYDGADFLFPTTQPTLPAELRSAVVSVDGAGVLDELGPLPPPTDSPQDASASAGGALTGGGGTATLTGTPEGCAAGTSITDSGDRFGMAPNQVLHAYGLDDLHDLGVRGEGTRVAIVDDSTYDAAWLDGYRHCFGLDDATPVTPHVLGTPGQSEAGETILDLSVMSAVAPKVDRFDVFMVDTSLTPDIDDLAAGMVTMFDSPLDESQTGGQAPDVVSASFALCEVSPLFWQGRTAAVAVMEDVLATGAAAGVSYLAASGDSGSSGCEHNLPSNDPAVTQRSTSYPSTSAWLTAVGGTNLTLDPDNDIVSTGTWNDEAYHLVADVPYGGGGGASTLVGRPWYQEGPGVPAGSARVVPDVSAFADSLPGYAILGPSASPAPTPDPGTWSAIGGTSAATPLLAGATLLWTQLARDRGQPDPGFLNPILYELGRSGSPSLRDITLSGNDLFSVGCCSATTGFDLATGWGSPRGVEMAVALANPALRVSAPPATVGGEVTFTADAAVPAGSVRSYAWDVGADGTVDATTTAPTYSVAATVAGAVAVRVEVSTTLGRTGTTTGSAVVTAAPAPLQGVPLAFTG